MDIAIAIILFFVLLELVMIRRSLQHIAGCQTVAAEAFRKWGEGDEPEESM